MDTLQTKNIVFIGVGNEYRRDDGVGIAVARDLRNEVPDCVKIVESDGEATALMEAWEGADVAIVCDAISSNAGPGTIYRFEAAKQPIPRTMFNCSTHDLGVAEAIELARAFGKLPPRLIVYGIEGKDFDEGTGLTGMVEEAACYVARSVSCLM